MQRDHALTVIMGICLIVVIASMGVMRLAEPGQPVISVIDYLVQFYFA